MLTVAQAGASPAVFTDDNFTSPSISWEGVKPTTDGIKLEVPPDCWAQTTRADFEQWMMAEDVATVEPGSVRLTATGDNWTARSSAPVRGGYGEAIVGAGEYIYLIEQHSASESAHLYRYDPENNNWSDNLATPSNAFKNGTALAWDNGNCIYALLGGSYTDKDATGRHYFYRYDIVDDSWQELEDTSSVNPHGQGAGDAMEWVHGGVMGSDGTFIYAIIGSSIHKPAKLGRYNIANNSWEVKRDPPAGVDDGCSLVWTGGKYLYALRGEYYESSPLHDFWRYDLRNDSWAWLAPIPSEPGGVGDGGSLVWSSGDYIYALSGGAYDENFRRNFYRYSISANSWERLADLPAGVGNYNGNRLAFVGDNLYCWRGTFDDDEGAGSGFWKYTKPSFHSAGTFESAVFDAGAIAHWENIWWEATVPNDTSLQIYVRTGNALGGSPSPPEWSNWVAVTNGTDPTTASTQYIQYKAELFTSDNSKAPLIHELWIYYRAPILRGDWQQSLWAQPTFPAQQSGKWASSYDNFYRSENLDFTQADEVKLTLEDGGYYGCEAVNTSRTSIWRMDEVGIYTSIRFTARATNNVSSIRVYVQENGGIPSYNFGIQADDSGLPSGTYLDKVRVDNTAITGTGWVVVDMPNSPRVIKNEVYHIVIEPDPDQPPSATSYIGIACSSPLHQKYPLTNEDDNAADTLYSRDGGANWSVRGKQPIYVLEFTDGTYEGNAFVSGSDLGIYGTTGVHSARGVRFTPRENVRVSGVEFFINRSGTPADSLYFSLEENDTGTIVEDGVLVEPIVPTGWAWHGMSFSEPRTLEAGKTYRLYMRSPGSTSSAYYRWCAPTTTSEDPYASLTYDGANTVYIDTYGVWSVDNTRDGGFRLVRAGSYRGSGYLESSVHDAGQIVKWGTLNWSARTPSSADRKRTPNAEPVTLIDHSLRVGSTVSSYRDVWHRDGICENLSEASVAYFYESSDDESSTTSADFQDKVTLSFKPDQADNYLVIASALVKVSNTEDEVNVRLLVDDVEYAAENFVASGAGSANYYPFAAHKIFYFDDSIHILRLQYNIERIAGTGYIKNARIFAIRVSDNTKADNSEDESQTNATFYQNKAVLSFTPASTENYLVLASAEVSGNSTGYSTCARLTHDGASQGEMLREPSSASAHWYTFALARRLELSGGIHEENLQYRAESEVEGREAKIRRARVAAVWLRDLGTFFTDNENEAGGMTSSTTYENVLRLHIPPTAAGRYLIIASAIFGQSDTSLYTTVDLDIDGADNTTASYRPKDATDDVPYFTIMVKELSAGPHEVTMKYTTSGASGTARIKNARIIIVELSPDYRLNWEHSISGVEDSWDNYELKVYGSSGDDENFGIYLWRSSDNTWELIDNFPTNDGWCAHSIDNISDYMIGDNLVVRSFENTADNIQTTIYIDYIALEAKKPYFTAVCVWTRSSSDGSSWSGWVEAGKGNDLPWESRYLQYRVEFSSSSDEATPMFTDLCVGYSYITWPFGTFTSQPLELGYVENWGELSWEVTLLENTPISFATRSSENGEVWSEWSETSSGIQSPIYGRRFLQVRITLQGIGTISPTLHSYIIAYEPDRTSPSISIDEPRQNFSTTGNSIELKGRIDDANPVSLWVDGLLVLQASGEFSARVGLTPGLNIIHLAATDAAGNSCELTFIGTRTASDPPAQRAGGEVEQMALMVAVGAVVVVTAGAGLTLLRRRSRVRRAKRASGTKRRWTKNWYNF